MTAQQRETIKKLRLSGLSYKNIGLHLGLPVGTVKAFCSRNSIKRESLTEELLCRFCHEPIQSIPNRKPRKFCSDACRLKWWGMNRNMRQSKGTIRRCAFCGKEYASYDATSRFCSHPCYISYRFGKGGEPLGA